VAGERTEQPTQRRLRDAKRRGQIARSKDLAETAGLIAILLVFGWMGGQFVSRLGDALRVGLGRMATGVAVELEPGLLVQLVVDGLSTLSVLVGPMAVAAAGAAVGVSTLQGGWNMAPEALALHWDRLNPASGVKRLFERAGIDLVKMLLAVTVVGWISWGLIGAVLDQAATYGRLTPMRAALQGWHEAERLLRQSAIALAVIAGVDYLLQRWRLQRSLRMTKQEVRDDLRLIEGNPEVKARVRRLQRDLARRRMLAAVPKATVIITNPTHYAVALEYRRDDLPAPRVLAKGKGFLAARIRELARAHEIPIVENPPLAQSLYRSVEVGEFIPADLFGAVAEVLAYLIRLRQLVV
jgi:flagellar biosynthetic protein FlhB